MGLGLVVEDESSDMYIGHSEHSLLCNIYDKSSCIGLICFARGIDFTILFPHINYHSYLIR